ncbi:MAG: response regulator [Rhodocyclaceae bacterium]
MMSHKKKILVIDDDDAVFAYLQKKIGDRYDLVTTTTPDSAVNLAIRETPDLILCDIDMPELTGGDVSVSFFENRQVKHIPFAYLTAYVSPKEVSFLDGNVGGRKGIAKRTPVPEMIQMIEHLLR